MGLQLSCFDTNRLNTFPDSSMARTITDGELTEFLANSSFLLEEKIPNKKDTFSKPLTKLEIYQVSSIETDYTPQPSDSIQNSPLLRSPSKKFQSKSQTRIYSSNATRPSKNIIESIIRSQSICSTSVNSGLNSRCTSPISKHNS